jgi:uncharacterized membrane protein
VNGYSGLKVAAAPDMRARRNLTRVDRLGYIAGGIALLLWALRKPSVAKTAGAGVGGWLLYQAWTGSDPMLRPLGIRVNPRPAEPQAAETLLVEEAITISRPRDEVYGFLRRAENLPRFRECSIEVIRDEPHQILAWRAVRDGKLMQFGSLDFRDAPGGRGTMVAARLEYVPAGGSLGTALAHIMGHSPQRLVAEGLRRARQLLETGVVSSTQGQPSGRR